MYYVINFYSMETCYKEYPAVLMFAFTQFTVVDKKFAARCKFCTTKRKIIKGSSKMSISNFTRHLKCVHSYRYKEFVARNGDSDVNRPVTAINEDIYETFSDKMTQIQSTTGVKDESSTSESKITDATQPFSNIRNEINLATNRNYESFSKATVDYHNIRKIQTDSSEARNSECQSSEEMSAPLDIATIKSKSTVQMTLAKPACKVCSDLRLLQNVLTEGARSCLKECGHVSNTCCCKRLIASLFDSELTTQPTNTELSESTQGFTMSRDASGVTRYFCVICLRNANRDTSRITERNQNWLKGMTFSTQKLKTLYMKRHQESQQHREALLRYNAFNVKQEQRGQPTVEEQCTATKHMLTAGMFMASNTLLFRLYPHLCAFLSLIGTDSESNPLGNRHQCHNSMKIITANYEAVKEQVKEKLGKISSVTCDLKKVLISADKGTAPKDATRQALVATHIGSNGFPTETPLRFEFLFESKDAHL